MARAKLKSKKVILYRLSAKWSTYRESGPICVKPCKVKINKEGLQEYVIDKDVKSSYWWEKDGQEKLNKVITEAFENATLAPERKVMIKTNAEGAVTGLNFKGCPAEEISEFAPKLAEFIESATGEKVVIVDNSKKNSKKK